MVTKLTVRRCWCPKIRYGSRQEAKRAGRQLPGRYAKLTAYRCGGGFWHLTSAGTANRIWYREREW